MNTLTQAHRLRPEDLPRSISATRVLQHDDFDPMWGGIIVGEGNKEHLPSQTILNNFKLRPKASLSGYVPSIGWSSSVYGPKEILHG